MVLEIYQIDAFTNKVFGGNPAAVCPLSEWLPDPVLLSIAKENNLAETAFFVKRPNGNYHLRWFTPRIEMDLCGHATLASASVLFHDLNHSKDTIFFETLSGILKVKKEEKFLEMDFPSRPAVKTKLPSVIENSLNIQPTEVYKDRDYLLVYDNEQDIIDLAPNPHILNKINLDPGGIIVTARGKSVDFVSRFFTPQAPIFEDPVTGSAHCTLTPFWADRLQKQELHALQVSERGGELFCRLENDRVFIKGKTVKYLSGQITI